MAGPYTTDKGKNVITDRLQTTPATYANGPKYVAYGTGNGVLQSGNDLDNQVQNKASGTESIETTTVTGDTYQVIATLTADDAYAITESGLFLNSANATGDMFAYSDFLEVNLNDGDSIQFTWRVEFT
jgi:hypothetical protein